MTSVFRTAGGRITTPPGSATDGSGLGFSLQRSVLTEEAAKAAALAARADRSAVRRDRFLDARQRTIGVSGPALSLPRSWMLLAPARFPHSPHARSVAKEHASGGGALVYRRSVGGGRGGRACLASLHAFLHGVVSLIAGWPHAVL